MGLNLSSKVALITCGTEGIGLTIARTLIREGAKVVITGKTQSDIDDAVSKLQSEGQNLVEGFLGDLSIPSTATALVQLYPHVTILVNNLEIFCPKPFESISDAEWVECFEVNVLSSLRLARLYLPRMKQANWGRIIFMSTECRVQNPADMIHYEMTRTAQLAVAREIAESVVGTNITANTILVGDEAGTSELAEAIKKSEGQTVSDYEIKCLAAVGPTSSLKALVSAAEISALVLHLAIPSSSTTSGQVFGWIGNA